MPTKASYFVPNKAVFNPSDLGVRESIDDMTRVIGELSFLFREGRCPAIVFDSHLLPGSPSIFMMARTAAWLASEHGFIVRFEFNDKWYRVYPFQTPEEVLDLYFYTLCASEQQKMAEHIARLESELADCMKTCDEEHVTRKQVQYLYENIDPLISLSNRY